MVIKKRERTRTVFIRIYIQFQIYELATVVIYRTFSFRAAVGEGTIRGRQNFNAGSRGDFSRVKRFFSRVHRSRIIGAVPPRNRYGCLAKIFRRVVGAVGGKRFFSDGRRRVFGESIPTHTGPDKSPAFIPYA